MKKSNVIFILILCISTSVFAQIRPIRDLSSLAQEKRQVFERWGDWRPEAKRFLGIPTNAAYYAVWEFSPTNRRYRDGNDIRPLKPDGLENQRNALYELYSSATAEVKAQTDAIKDAHLAEFTHITKETSKIDPLYLLYYRKRLENLRNINSMPEFINFYIGEEVDLSVRTSVPKMYEEFEVLKDKLDASHDANMDRGKRFLNYHEILLDLRKLENTLASYKRNENRLINTTIKIKSNVNTGKDLPESMNDRERFMEMALNNPNFY